jgi:elongation factor P hydroxylase
MGRTAFLMSVRKIIKLFSRFPPDQRVRAVLSLFRVGPTSAGQSGPLVAVEATEDVFFFGFFSALIADLRAAGPIKTDLLQTYTLCRTLGTGFRARAVRSAWITSALDNKWAYVYGCAIGGGRYVTRRGANCSSGAKARALELWAQIKQGQRPEELCVDGIQIGDLVIDSFLRIKPAAHFDASDPFVYAVILQAIQDVLFACRYFRENRPLLYLSSYTTYLEHGIPVRAAVACGVPVRVYGEVSAIGKELTADDMFHMPTPTRFKRLFDMLPASSQSVAMRQANAHLGCRFAGGRDPGNYYMRTSAYVSSHQEVPDVQGAVVIFLHDFFDSPHVWPDLIFQDFWEWICFSIESLTVRDAPVWVKPHPNRIPLNEAVLKELARRYPQVRFIDSRVTNKQLVEAGMRCGVTAYGSVAHELAYWGIPTIGCARHSHVSFGFCRTARSVSEYRHLLQTADSAPLNAVEMREQALAWYYMAHLSGGAQDVEFRAAVAQFRMACDDGSIRSEEVVEALCKVRATVGWQIHVDRVFSDISKRDTHERG